MTTYSNIVYLYGDKLIPEAKLLNQKEELPNGTKVNQKKLVEAAVFAAFLQLKEKGYINIFLREGGFLIFKTKSPYVTKIKNEDNELSGLELEIIKHISGDTKVDQIIRQIIYTDSYNPWAVILQPVKNDLQAKGLIQIEEAGKVLFVKKYKTSMGELGEEEQKVFEDYQRSVNNFKNDPELFNKLERVILNSIAGMVTQNDSRFD